MTLAAEQTPGDIRDFTTLEQISDISQAVAAIAVVLPPVALIPETRQNTKIMRATAVWDFAVIWQNHQAAIVARHKTQLARAALGL